jgi:hypothetical protein
MIGQQPMQAAQQGWSFPSQCLGDFLARLDKVDPKPSVLDLGILCGDNIAFLGQRGCRVSVETLPGVASLAPPPPPKNGRVLHEPPAPMPPLTTALSCLRFPPETFAGVLAWDAIARVPQARAVEFVDALRGMMQWGGVLLAYFPSAATMSAQISGRYRILGTGRLVVEPAKGPHPQVKSYENREIYAMFARLDIIRISQLKSGAREVLVARSRKESSAGITAAS